MKPPAINVLKVLWRGGREAVPIGRLASHGHRVFYEYDAEFLAGGGPSLSPVHLPLKPGVFEEPKRVFDGLFGLFHDSLPDGWGTLLLDRVLQWSGIDRGLVTPIHRLAHVGQRGMGALAYEPEILSESATEARVDLDAIAKATLRVLEGEPDDVFPELLHLSGSSGGARPKALVGWRASDNHLVHGIDEVPVDHVPHLIKFRATADPIDAGHIEFAYSQMARAAGLDVAEAHLFEGRRGPGYFGTRRFDRTANGNRIHVHSLGGLVHASHRVPGSYDYDRFLRLTRALTRDQREVERAFRLMAFNVLGHNRDDHVKNFAFIMDHDGQFRLAPAFDLTFSDTAFGQHWMAVAGEGIRPTEVHYKKVAAGAGLSDMFVDRCLADVRDAVARWDEFARDADLTRSSRERIAEQLGVEMRRGVRGAKASAPSSADAPAPDRPAAPARRTPPRRKKRR